MTAPSERRLAAILAADVVGYSRLMEADEKGTHERLRALRKELIEPPIGAHRGRIVKLTGDGALVEFPSVVDAVECAVAVLQKGGRRAEWRAAEQQQLWLRLGINIGDIILEDGASTAMASTSRHGSKAWPSRAGSASHATCTTRSRTRSASASSRWASTGSRTSPSRSRSTGSAPALGGCRRWEERQRYGGRASGRWRLRRRWH